MPFQTNCTAAQALGSHIMLADPAYKRAFHIRFQMSELKLRSAVTWLSILDCNVGRGLERRALPPPEPTQRISSHPYSAPLFQIRTDNMLPTKLLTPFQAGIPS